MKKIFGLLAVFGLYGVSSCHKDDGTTDAYVQGTVVNNYDLKPQPDADVYFVKLVGSPGTSTGYEVLDSTKADSKGHFRFNYQRAVNIQYAVRGKHPNYYYVPAGVSYTNFGSKATTDSLLVGLYPKSYLKISIKDTSRIEKYKGVRFITTFFQPDYDFFSYPLDTTVIIGADYNGPNYTWYLLYENNRWGTFNRGSLKCLPFDTCKINIKF